MNDFLRLLRSLLRRYGYDVKKYYEYNLLPLNNQASFNQIARLAEAAERDQHSDDAGDPELQRLNVCLRTCLRDRPGRAAQPPGPTGADREEIALRCLKSLIASINHALRGDHGLEITLTVFDDHSTVDAHAKIVESCEKASCAREVRTTREPGQGASLLEQFEFARENRGLFYFCEDDYLHEPSAIAEMHGFYRKVYHTCGTHLVIHPQEHEFLYTKAIYPAYLLLGEHRHWRTISHATHVLFTHADVVRKYWRYFENTRHVGDRSKRRLGSEAKTTNLLFDHLPGFAPIPALAAHMQTAGSLPPFFNWRALWEQNRPD